MLAMVVIPTYNERENIAAIVNAVLSQGEEFHVTIVDDNSPDGTGIIADQLVGQSRRVHVLHRPQKQGLGAAYVAGFTYALKAGADYIFEMDADFSHNPELLPNFIAAMEHADVVIGSRYINGLAVVNWSVKRLILSMSANLYARTITGLRLHDCTGGYKCFKREVLESIDISHVYANGYAFQVEMNYRAQCLGYRLIEIPIVFVDRLAGQSKMSTRIAREAFWHIFRMRVGHLVNPQRFARRPVPVSVPTGLEPS